MRYLVLFCLIFNIIFAISKPQIIPEIKDWQSYDSTFKFNHDIKIVYNFNQKNELEEISQTFSDDINYLKKWKINIQSAHNSEKNSVFLIIDSTINHNEEFYLIEISDRIVIVGKTPKAVFWGTRTILQMLKINELMECGKIIDFPDYKERGLMIDLGRRYHTIQWLENHIMDLSFLKMNLFHLHLSDNEGFRLECETYPQITSKDHYTKQQIRDLQKLANKYFVELVPEIDMPSHMASILKYFPELQVFDNNGNSGGPCCLDFTKQESRELVKNIILEYINIFNGRYWHLGTDEYIIDFEKYSHIKEWAEEKYGSGALAEDAFFDFINWVNQLVKSNKKQLRVWNDWSNFTFNKNTKTFVDNDIIIDYWNGNYPISNFIDKSFSLMNCSVKYLYYVLPNPYVNNEYIYNHWNVNDFSSFEEEKIVPNHTNILGAKFHIWNDVSEILTENENQTANTIKKVLRIVSLKTWHQNHTLNSFKLFNNLIEQIGRAPAYFEPESPIPNNLAFKKSIYASSIENNSEELSPLMANDGYYTSRWASKISEAEWIYVDFGEKTKFTTVRLNWEYSYATDYAIQISDDAINWKDIYTTSTGKGSYEIIDNLNSEARFLKIDCRKRVAWNGYSLWEFEVYDSNAISQIYDLYPDKDFAIFPNPANDFITITSLEKNIKVKSTITPIDKIEIYNVIGTLVQSFPYFSQNQNPKGKFNLDISNLPSGIYLIKIGNRIKKFFKY